MNKTEQKLKTLFDYQRFEQNDKLEKLIREAETGYARELSDDELMFVNAAGDPAGNVDSSESPNSFTGDNCANKDKK